MAKATTLMQVSLLLRVLADGKPLSDVAEHEAVKELQRKGLVGKEFKLTRQGLNRADFLEGVCVCCEEGLSRGIEEAVKKAADTKDGKG